MESESSNDHVPSNLQVDRSYGGCLLPGMTEGNDSEKQNKTREDNFHCQIINCVRKNNQNNIFRGTDDCSNKNDENPKIFFFPPYVLLILSTQHSVMFITSRCRIRFQIVGRIRNI